MLDTETRSLLEHLAAALLRMVDHHRHAGDERAALVAGDAADGLMALLDFDAERRGTIQAG